ncbi:MAG: SMP-30/gluconolactonase/LRE family protein [Christensenella sp.]|nr:SMP-30/gluconolactonase/LRE family protein [Christensenella sp.]
MSFELILDVGMEIAETPIWDERINKLYYTDLFKGAIHRYDPKSKTEETWNAGSLIGSAVPTTDENVLFCALESGMYLLDLKSGALELLCDPENGNPDNRYNDTRIDPVGRIFTSSVSKLYGTDQYQPDMLGNFYMVDTDGSIQIIEEGINQYNAIVWNSNATKMFVVDTYHETLLVYDYDLEKGPVGSKKEAIAFGELGMPDGMSIDSDDNLYVCHWTKKISVWDKDLQRKEVMSIPVEYACCTGFGGEDMKDLYLATAKYCYSEEQLKANKGAGGIFRARNAVRGTGDHFYQIKR